MTFIQAIILGVVEGITEFLPISSTGHMILANRLLGIQPSDFVKSFEIAIQLGAILSVVVLYWKKILNNFSIIPKIITAFIPTALIGLVFYGIVKKYLLGNEQVVIWSLLIGGVFIIVFELLYKPKDDEANDLAQIPYASSFLIGLSQALAIVPGVSRSAATVFGGLALRIKRKTIVEFSFLLAVPTMVAATGLDLIKMGSSFSGHEFYLMAIGFVTSFLVALAVIKIFIKFVQNNSFMAFGVYRILIALIFWLIVR